MVGGGYPWEAVLMSLSYFVHKSCGTENQNDGEGV